MEQLAKITDPADLRILLVDDNPQNLQALGNHLKALPCQLLFALDGHRTLEAIGKHRPHLILMDIQMPDMDGFELCQKIKDDPETADIPVIFLTAAYRDQESILKGFRVGGVDFITKPYHREELLARVKTHLKLKAYQDHFRNMSIRDPLTRIYNRRFMTERIANEEARNRRSGQVFTIALGDLDNFKRINDNYGHACGDEVLVRTAEALEGAIRKTDAVARWGGEEFLVLLPDTDLDGARVVLERMLNTVRDLSVPCGRQTISPTLTCGAADSRSANQGEAVVRNADMAMYRGKTAGKNRLVFFSAELDSPEEDSPEAGQSELDFSEPS
jgi:diguanylate cyclase (GGDEF)-like protein